MLPKLHPKVRRERVLVAHDVVNPKDHLPVEVDHIIRPFPAVNLQDDLDVVRQRIHRIHLFFLSISSIIYRVRRIGVGIRVCVCVRRRVIPRVRRCPHSFIKACSEFIILPLKFIHESLELGEGVLMIEIRLGDEDEFAGCVDEVRLSFGLRVAVPVGYVVVSVGNFKARKGR